MITGLEGLQGFKILSDNSYTVKDGIGLSLFIASIIFVAIGVILIIANISCSCEMYVDFSKVMFVVSVLIIGAGVFLYKIADQDKYKYLIQEYSITPIEETYSIDMTKYKILKTVDEIITIQVKEVN